MSSPAHHAALSAQRWARFSWDQQILSIAAEANRGLKDVRAGRSDSARSSYERVLTLLELTAGLASGAGRLKEITRLKEFTAGLFIAQRLDLADHQAMMRSLLQMSPQGLAQIQLLHDGLSQNR